MHIWILLHIHFPSPVLRCSLREKKKVVLVRRSALLKLILNRKFLFLICLKIDYSDFKAVNFFPSHTQIHEFHFELKGTFFHCPSPFAGFSSRSNLHSQDLLLIIRDTRFHNQFCLWSVTSFKSTTG